MQYQMNCVMKKFADLSNVNLSVLPPCSNYNLWRRPSWRRHYDKPLGSGHIIFIFWLKSENHFEFHHFIVNLTPAMRRDVPITKCPRLEIYVTYDNFHGN